MAVLAIVAVALMASQMSHPNVASTYFAGYHANRGFPVSKMPWDKYTDVKYAFAETTANGSLDLSQSAPDQLPVFVADAKANNVKALVSIGGWTGSRYFSTSVGSPENRTAFVKTCIDMVDKYGLDGLDFDFEYPNRQSTGCNLINANDTDNFLAFLQELREQTGAKNLTLTAAGSLNPWNNATGLPSTDLAGFAKVLDYITVMGYDIYGPWAATAGPNAPLSMACDTRNTQGGITESIVKWVQAGIPPNQIVLGAPAYGHGFSVNKTSAFIGQLLDSYPPHNRSSRFQGSSWDTDPAIDICGNAQSPGGTYPFWSLITEAGFLTEQGGPQPGIKYGYDNCSRTPYAYNSTSEIWVSYDNQGSFAEKGDFIKENKLRGFAMWEAGGDYNNTLVNAIRQGAGFK